MAFILTLFRAGIPMLVIFLFEVTTYLHPALDWYGYWWWFDIPMHIVGGFVAAWSLWRFFFAYQSNGMVRIEPRSVIIFFLISWAAFAGVLWEVYEFTHDTLFPEGFLFQPSIHDTMADLILDVFGGSVFAAVVLVLKRK